MKRVFSILLIVAVLLTGCAEMAQAEEQVEQLLNAISDESEEAAKALIYPDELTDEEVFSAKFLLWCKKLDGRKFKSYFINSVKLRVNDGVRTEEGEYWVTLEDGEKLTVSYTYVTDGENKGFTDFSVGE